MTDQQAIHEAYRALCRYNSPSLTKEQTLDALGECWIILSTAVQSADQKTIDSRLNNWIDGNEKGLE